MSQPNALGFYARHCLIMDRIYDLLEVGDGNDFAFDSEYGLGLPDAFRQLVEDHSAKLIQLCEQIDRDLKPFEDLYVALRDRLAKGANVGKPTSFSWDRKITAKSTRFKPTRSFEIGWSWEIAEAGLEGDEALFLNPWIWMTGRIGESRLMACLKEFCPSERIAQAKPAREIDSYDWNSGVVRLDRINVTGRVGDDFSLDVGKLADEVADCFGWISPPNVSSLFRIDAPNRR